MHIHNAQLPVSAASAAASGAGAYSERAADAADPEPELPNEPIGERRLGMNNVTFSPGRGSLGALGCSKCYYSINGCTTCRQKVGWVPADATKKHWVPAPAGWLPTDETEETVSEETYETDEETAMHIAEHRAELEGIRPPGACVIPGLRWSGNCTWSGKLMARMQMQKQQDEMDCAADQQLKKDTKIALQLSVAHTPDNDDMSASDKNALQMQEQRMQKEAGSARRQEKKDLEKAINLSKKEKSMPSAY